MNRRLAALVAAVPAVAAGAFAVNAVTGESAAAKRPAADYIQGTVTSAKAKPEAGVWVIAETKLGTAYRKIVVTDPKGRFMLPQLPKGKYRVWVRGYGLQDSAKVAARPGATLALRVKKAPSTRAAAKIYPANYWLSLFNPPNPSPDFASSFKLGCMLCHQIGSKTTRSLGSREAYDHGTKKAATMYGVSVGLGRDALLDALADWSGRIAGGETPKTPPRPRGIERNMVITQWDWGNKFTYAHDEIATDKNNPRRNANGPVWGVDIGNDYLLRTDPIKNTSTKIKVPTLNGFSTPWADQTSAPGRPGGFSSLGAPATAAGGVSAYPGAYNNPANPHNPMMDAKGRIWITTQIRREWQEDIPAFCRADPAIAGRSHHRQLGYYDPKTKKFQLIDTCFGTHHLQFDKKGKLWLSGDSYVLGWFDPAKYDPARPETAQTAQGFAEVIVDSNGDGVPDKKVPGFNYGIIASPDGTVWTGQPSTGPRGLITRFDPATGKFESYIPPVPGSGPRGVDADSKGVIWAAMGGSGHLASFDRRKCKQTWGDGTQCAEGWTFFRPPGPAMRGSTPADERTADMHYYLFVDQHNTLGLGKDAVVLNGTNSDSLQVFNQKTRRFTTIRIPYPLNSYQRGADGRIDDPKAGWKGRGLWFNLGADPIIHTERQQGYVAKVQLRPNPLAK